MNANELLLTESATCADRQMFSGVEPHAFTRQTVPPTVSRTPGHHLREDTALSAPLLQLTTAWRRPPEVSRGVASTLKPIKALYAITDALSLFRIYATVGSLPPLHTQS